MPSYTEVRDAIRQFNIERDWDQFHTEANLAKSVCIEAGELLECFQFSDQYDLQAAKEELADVVNYCIVLADRMNIDLMDALMEKLQKNIEKYPVDLAKGKSTKYDRLLKKE